jgi:hypothetical protein
MGVTPWSLYRFERHRREIKPRNRVVIVVGCVAMSYITEIGHFSLKFVLRLFLVNIEQADVLL